MRNIFAALLIVAPLTAAYAWSGDVPTAAANVTLTIENDAGIVSTLSGMTQRECGTAAGLLTPSPSAFGITCMSCQSSPFFFPNGASIAASPQPHTSAITKASCSVPAPQSKP